MCSSALLEVVPNPLTHACEITGASAEEKLLGAAGKLVVAARPLPEQANGAGEIRTGATFGQSVQGARPPKAYRTSKHVRGKLGKPGQLAATAGQHDGLHGLRGMRASGKPPPHQVEDLLDARPDDHGELGLGDLIHEPALTFASGGEGDDLALVGGRREGAAMKRLQALRVLQRRSKRAGDVGGDAGAAERDGVGVDEMPVGEDRERGGAGAEIDAGDAKLGFVRGDYGESARVRGGD